MGALAGALEATYIDLQTRERPEYQNKVINIYTNSVSENEISVAADYERAYVVARDLGGADPGRMAPPDMATYVNHVFKRDLPNISIRIIDDQEYIKKEFPAFQ